MAEDVERESMEYDVVIVGAGPSGLAAAIRLKQLAAEAGSEVSVAVLEKGSEVGAHILSGAIIDPKALTELFPDWKALGAPLETAVTKDKFLYLGEQAELDILMTMLPAQMSEAEIEAAAKAKAAEMGVTDKTKANMLMGALMKDLKGKAIGVVTLVSQS